ncbi:MAG: YgaP-like transmembrane domain, partial [Candidatus Limnocylindrales bacterium]
MKTNESTADRIVRIVVGAILAVLAITGVATGALALVAWV